MPAPLSHRLGLAAVFLSAAAAAGLAGVPDSQEDPLAWPVPTQTSRPWARWWWLGSAVDSANLQRLLGEYRDAGLGGVEICPIYGAKGYEKRFIDYLSPEWMEMLSVTTNTAARLGMGVDMTTGTGWPMGGPWIPADQASESASLRRFPLGPGGAVDDSVVASALGQEQRPAAAAAPGGSKVMDGMVSGPGARPSLVCLRAAGPDGSQVDLAGRLKGGRLDWSAPGAGWTLYSLTTRQPVQKVKRAAPGGAGNVADPYSVSSLGTYLSRFDTAFHSYGGPMPRAQFQDSFEYFGANWTPGFLGEFARRRGYDLLERLPELAGDGNPDTAARVREDYRRTLGELHQAYVARWTLWAHSHGSLTREQAHGAPANIEDVYASADIAETEGSFGGSSESQVPMLKFASSAAHVTGRALASSETFTWLGEHFQVPLSQLKAPVDTFFLSGINHMFFHGIPYSPSDAPWPGWLFYASVNFGPNGGIWHDLPAFTAYATRCQSILQAGRPDNDILLYFPVADFWQQGRPDPAAGPRLPPGVPSDPLVLQFTTPGKWMIGTPFHSAAMELWHKGFAFDEVTDALLSGARVDPAGPGGQAGSASIHLGGSRYGAVVVPPCRIIPVETLAMLLDLARQGATVVFSGGIPSDVPGLADLEARRAKVASLLKGIRLEAPEGGGPHEWIRSARLGKGIIWSQAQERRQPPGGLSTLLESAGIARERMCDDGLSFIRRAREGGTDYFIVNTGGRTVEGWVALSRPAASAALMDPLFPNRNGIAATRAGPGGLSVYLQAAPGQSYVLRTFRGSAPPGPPWRYLRASPGPPLALGGDWAVHFAEGGPALPRDFHEAELASWTGEDDPEAKRFSGTAVYSLSFSLPQGLTEARDWRLDLGRVAESARVRLNGRDVATLWCAPFSADVGAFLGPGRNLLEVEVTNVAANRIRDLDLRHVDWKSFYEINFVNHSYRAFDASAWPVRDSGLLGPVVLIPMEAAPLDSPP